MYSLPDKKLISHKNQAQFTQNSLIHELVQWQTMYYLNVFLKFPSSYRLQITLDEKNKHCMVLFKCLNFNISISLQRKL